MIEGSDRLPAKTTLGSSMTVTPKCTALAILLALFVPACLDVEAEDGDAAASCRG
jgi:hypothetical protein